MHWRPGQGMSLPSSTVLSRRKGIFRGHALALTLVKRRILQQNSLARTTLGTGLARIGTNMQHTGVQLQDSGTPFPARGR